jgi:hypothetical protein
MKSVIAFGLVTVSALALLVAGGASRANAAPLQRMAADFQNNTTVGGTGEISTTATPTSGGLLVYQKTLSIPFEVVYITFSAQGDVHNGSALLMQAAVDDAAGNETICQPMAGQTGGGGGGPTVFPQWMTLLKVPVISTVTAAPDGFTTNCNDGGGGSGDCHDNTIMFSCCALIRPDSGTPPTTHTVNIRLADLPGGDSNFAFYERSTIYVDASPNPGGKLCTGAGLPGGAPE